MPVYRIDNVLAFPPPEEAEPNGLLAVGGDLSPRRLVLAYAMGIFPWYTEGSPILWFSPDPRGVLLPERLSISRSLRKRLRGGDFEVSLDSDFGGVLRRCAEVTRPGQDGTWITVDMIEAYDGLFELGVAHSVEVRREGRLAGGLYGVSLGSAFFGESMFSLEPDASKIALVWLARQLQRRGFEMIDCQVRNEHLRSMGAEEWPRERFLTALARCLQTPTQAGPWSFDAGFDPVASCGGGEDDE
ncbi:MAG: leucyl/phenylalanyl-tRNA--protein transferase [Deltaproteobacteria bacterium]|nr:leucyl/phenylalanyl-tRNA--protein transferase [Deltaproteobacteria bacterium]